MSVLEDSDGPMEIDWEKDFDQQSEMLIFDTLKSEETGENMSESKKISFSSSMSSIPKSMKKGKKKQSAQMRNALDKKRRREKRQQADVIEREKSNLKSRLSNEENRLHQLELMKSYHANNISMVRKAKDRVQNSNTQSHQNRRRDELFRNREQEKDTKKRREKRQMDDDFRQKERVNDRERRAKARNSEKAIRDLYQRGIKERLEYVCVSCAGLFFKRSVVPYYDMYYKDLLKFAKLESKQKTSFGFV